MQNSAPATTTTHHTSTDTYLEWISWCVVDVLLHKICHPPRQLVARRSPSLILGTELTPDPKTHHKQFLTTSPSSDLYKGRLRLAQVQRAPLGPRRHALRLPRLRPALDARGTPGGSPICNSSLSSVSPPGRSRLNPRSITRSPLICVL